ncbi:Fic/DOC family protein [Maribacter dokdonensis]|uniref:RhuM family protein n=1 Tax=Maribacter dokdonensis TaxID=320912 RepID=UPI001AFD11B3|nr:RhuM family protein [Maribacter dokdonensis]CAG2534351.1 Fic/DOC family protein [Maribacter dokdonensis]
MQDIIIYKAKDNQIEVEVQFDGDTAWLSQGQLSELFQQTKQNISLHINNCFREGELDKDSVVKESLTTASDGKKYKTKKYNLDVIISVGYRIKSNEGTQFRIWATRVLKEYLVKGYAINEKRLQQSQKQLAEFKRLAQLQAQVIEEYPLSNNETKGLIQVIANYATALELLDDYDHQRLQLPKEGSTVVVQIEYPEAKKAIEELGRQTQFKGLFGKEKDDSFKGSLENIYQTFDGVDLYRTTEEKAAHLLYFVVKNHSFTDGNKRIAAFIFVWFLERNHLLYRLNGEKIVADTTLVALTLMIAQSHPADKDMMVKVVVNLLT